MNKDDKNITWVPDNLSALKKALHTVPSTYGLPMFHLYYSVAHKDYDGVSNRLKKDKSNALMHAFRIIVGLTWNWFVSRIAGMKLTEVDLNRTITAKICLAANIKDKNLDLQWNELLGIDIQDPEFKKVLQLQHKIMELKTVEEGQAFAANLLSKFAIQCEALTTLVPIEVQHNFKIRFGNKAIQEFKNRYQDVVNARFDITKDICAWACNYNEETIRTCSWLSGKQIQRLLKKAGIHNSKSKHRRKEKDNGKDHND